MPLHLPKHMEVGHKEPPLPAIYHCRQPPSNPSAVEIAEGCRSRTLSMGTRAFDFGNIVGLLMTKHRWQGRANGETRRRAEQRQRAPSIQLAPINWHGERIRIIQNRIYQYVFEASKHEWPPNAHQSSQALNPITWGVYATGKLYTFPRRSENQQALKSQIRQIVKPEHYGTCTKEMGFTHCACFYGRQHYSTMCRLSEIERPEKSRLIPNTLDGQVNWLLRRYHSTRNVWRKKCVLANRDLWCWSR